MTSTRRLRGRARGLRLGAIIVALGVLAALSGCIVVPAYGPGYGYGYYYGHPHYWR